MSCKIYIADVSDLSNEKIFAKEYNQISDFRKAKIDKMRFDKDKNLSLGVGLLLKNALSECGIDENNASYSLSEKGKPFIKNAPFNFSLSHSGKFAMCAVSDCEIGCDVEAIKDVDFSIAHRFFCENEIVRIENQPDKKSGVDMFYRLWTLKESFMKATGLGMSLPLNKFSIDLGESIKVNQSLNKNSYKFCEFDINSDYKFSCCLENPKDTEKPKIIVVNFA